MRDTLLAGMGGRRSFAVTRVLDIARRVADDLLRSPFSPSAEAIGGNGSRHRSMPAVAGWSQPTAAAVEQLGARAAEIYSAASKKEDTTQRVGLFSLAVNCSGCQ